MKERKKGYRKRPKQLFIGELTDSELHFIEYALNYIAEHYIGDKAECEKIINKLYSVFYEKRENGKICYEKQLT